MARLAITYFFSFLLVASVIGPTYETLFDSTAEISVVTDFGEEEEKKNGEESIKDLEVKIFYSEKKSLFWLSEQKNKRINFYPKNYTSHFKKLTSPPPELIG